MVKSDHEIEEWIEEVTEKDREVNAFIHLDKRGVAWRQRGSGELQDFYVGIKSNICVEGLPTTAASKTLENYVPPYDATVVERIRAAGGIIIGMTNMDEFACGSSGETSYFGPTQNPAAWGRIPGGSSSGSAAAVAAGFVRVALGSDTGGSIRNPCSHCGVFGFKPTYGLVSRYGLIDLAMSLDQIGPIARSTSDIALVMEVISGPDGKDETLVELSSEAYKFYQNLEPKLDGIRLGYAQEFDELIVDAGIKLVIHKALEKLEANGAKVVEVTLPNLEAALPTYYLNVYVEFYSATRRYDGRRYGHRIEEVCGEEVLRRILLGKFISRKEHRGKYYEKALAARSLLREELLASLREVDLLAGPTVPKLPHRLGEKVEDPLVMYAYDIFTVPANLAGLPAGVLPAGEVGGIPTGLQLIGKPFEDQLVLDVMFGCERVLQKSTLAPK